MVDFLRKARAVVGICLSDARITLIREVSLWQFIDGEMSLGKKTIKIQVQSRGKVSEVTKVVRSEWPETHYYTLEEAAEIAECEVRHLLNFADMGKIDIVTPVPFGVVLHQVDRVSGKLLSPSTQDGSPACMPIPEVLVVSNMLRDEIERSDSGVLVGEFDKGYSVLGGQRRISPFEGKSSAEPSPYVWQTFRDGKSYQIQLTKAALYVASLVLMRLIEEGKILRVAREDELNGLEAPSIQKSESKSVEVTKPVDVKVVEFIDSGLHDQSGSVEHIEDVNGVDFKLNIAGVAADCDGGGVQGLTSPRPPQESERDMAPHPEIQIERNAVSKAIIDRHKEPSVLVKEKHTIISIKGVIALTNLSRSTIYAMNKEGSKYEDPSFPKSYQISAGRVGWIEEEIQAWIKSRARA